MSLVGLVKSGENRLATEERTGLERTLRTVTAESVIDGATYEVWHGVTTTTTDTRSDRTIVGHADMIKFVFNRGGRVSSYKTMSLPDGFK